MIKWGGAKSGVSIHLCILIFVVIPQAFCIAPAN